MRTSKATANRLEHSAVRHGFFLLTNCAFLPTLRSYLPVMAWRRELFVSLITIQPLDLPRRLRPAAGAPSMGSGKSAIEAPLPMTGSTDQPWKDLPAKFRHRVPMAGARGSPTPCGAEPPGAFQKRFEGVIPNWSGASSRRALRWCAPSCETTNGGPPAKPVADPGFDLRRGMSSSKTLTCPRSAK